MSNVFFLLTLVSAVAVVLSLFGGLIVMGRGGELSRKYSNKLMQARVISQGAAILFFILAILSVRH